VPCFARALASKGYSGLEHIVGIPGSLGGLIVMNGGSQRRGIGENIVKVWTVDSDGNEKNYIRKECNFGYRSSDFQTNHNIIIKAELELIQGNVSDVRKTMLEIFKSRRGKFPKNYPNCGSVFLSNPAYYHQFGPPGMIIEKLGLKGMKKGRAQISPQHANFIINLGGATSSDIQFLIQYAHKQVIDELGLSLEPEVKYLHPKNGIQNVL
jgi:UDP-N-acetylmuramate dehydrogenase